MVQEDDNSLVSVVHPICCGLDVHKETLAACLLLTGADGRIQSEIKEFATFTDDLLRLREWLAVNDCPVVAMESTGVYWRPVHNVLEGQVTVILVNARHIKNVPGRKTDVADSQWLAGLLRLGLLKGSFLPPQEVRQWRELARLRKHYQESIGDFKRQVHKLLESSNIKLAAVLTDIFGATGRLILERLAHQDGIPDLSDLERGAGRPLRHETQELRRAVWGFFTAHHRFQLCLLLRSIRQLEGQLGEVLLRLEEQLTSHQELRQRLQVVPGISQVASAGIMAEVGPSLADFKSSDALSSWSGLCPGNNQSAGKRKSGRSPVRSHPLKTLMVQVAWAAVKKKGSYYKDKFHRLRYRLGPKKAIVAIAHRLLKAVYHIIKDGAAFRDLGEDYLQRRHHAGRLNYLKKQAQLLGYQLIPATA